MAADLENGGTTVEYMCKDTYAVVEEYSSQPNDQHSGLDDMCKIHVYVSMCSST